MFSAVERGNYVALLRGFQDDGGEERRGVDVEGAEFPAIANSLAFLRTKPCVRMAGLDRVQSILSKTTERGVEQGEKRGSGGIAILIMGGEQRFVEGEGARGRSSMSVAGRGGGGGPTVHDLVEAPRRAN